VNRQSIPINYPSNTQNAAWEFLSTTNNHVERARILPAETAEQPVRGDIIRKALVRLDFMGLNIKDALINHLQQNGMILDNAHYYSLKDIEKQMREIFGQEATLILLAKIEGGIRAQYF
jgi:hypothetical protein